MHARADLYSQLSDSHSSVLLVLSSRSVCKCFVPGRTGAVCLKSRTRQASTWNPPLSRSSQRVFFLESSLNQLHTITQCSVGHLPKETDHLPVCWSSIYCIYTPPVFAPMPWLSIFRFQPWHPL